MTTYLVTETATGAEVYRYQSDTHLAACYAAYDGTQ